MRTNGSFFGRTHELEPENRIEYKSTRESQPGAQCATAFQCRQPAAGDGIASSEVEGIGDGLSHWCYVAIYTYVCRSSVDLRRKHDGSLEMVGSPMVDGSPTEPKIYYL